jgi:alkanesulfonate monooxygenase SsuD/methylene tetrahydromethanopterin reductase-like flavin-dependent oxidoreductase (luciferase family)
VHQGKNFTVPLAPGEGTGLGKPLKILAHPVRADIPIWIAALGEKNVAMTAEVADGWLPIFFIPERAKDVWGVHSPRAGPSGRSRAGRVDDQAGGLLAIGEGEDVTRLARVGASGGALRRWHGRRGKNFYNELAVRYGFERRPP